MNSVQNYGIASQPTNFKGGIKQRAQRLIDYPLVKHIIKENPTVHPREIFAIMKAKVKEITAHNKEFQMGRMTQEEACDKALNMIL